MSEEINYQKLEEQRVEALASQDAKTYSRLCAELGVEPEDCFLIERAEADRLVADGIVDLENITRNQRSGNPRRRQRKRTANPAKYQRFLNDALSIYDSSGRFSDDADTKRRVLQSHFPYRFTQRQPIDGYDDAKVGKLFNDMVESAEEIVSRKN